MGKLRTRRGTQPHRMPIGPWREWLLRREAEYRLDGDDWDQNHFPVRSRLASDLGVPERTIFRWIHESSSVDMWALDNALTHYGRPEVLRELYPEWAEQDAAYEHVADLELAA